MICIDTKDDPQQAVIAGRVAVNLAHKVSVVVSVLFFFLGHVSMYLFEYN